MYETVLELVLLGSIPSKITLCIAAFYGPLCVVQYLMDKFRDLVPPLHSADFTRVLMSANASGNFSIMKEVYKRHMPFKNFESSPLWIGPVLYNEDVFQFLAESIAWHQEVNPMHKVLKACKQESRALTYIKVC